MLIVDGHEDLAYNVLVDGRNYLQSAYITRVAEEGGPVPAGNGLCMLGLPEWLKGNVGVIMADKACLEALESYDGPVVATHANPRRLVQMHRMLRDEVITGIAAIKGENCLWVLRGQFR
jgi:hypothetical protein